MATISSEERRRLAAAYAAGVSSLLMPAAPASMRATATARPRRRTDGLLKKSRALTQAAGAALVESESPLDRAAAEVQLLAGAALDLAVAGELAGTSPLAATRTLGAPAVNLAELQALIAAPEAYLRGATAAMRVRGLADTREALRGAVRSALAAIQEDVVTTGGHVVQGMLMMDAALLREALAVVGSDLAARLRVDLAGLAGRAVDFVISANEKLIALIGLDAVAEAQKQLHKWLDDLKAGTLFPELAEHVLGTADIATEVEGWIAQYRGDEGTLLLARDQIGQLASHFGAKLAVADRLVSLLALAKLAPPLMTPAGRLGVAAAYLALLAYTVGSGYDHVDSDRIKLLDWVEGVRGIAKRTLVAGA